MSAKFFLDTNILVYSFDHQAPEKRTESIALIQHALETGEGVISTQVVQEFLNVATRRFDVPMKIADSRRYLQKVLNPLCTIYPNLALYEVCLEIQSETGFSFYDSLIIAAAERGGCALLYSEDLQDGQLVRGVEIKNPYKASRPA